VDGYTGSRIGPPRQTTLDWDESGPQDPSAGDARVGGRKRQGQSHPLTQDPTTLVEKPLPQTTDKPSLFRRAIRKLERFVKSESDLTFLETEMTYMWSQELFCWWTLK